MASSTVTASPAIGTSVQSLPLSSNSTSASKPSSAFFGASLKKSAVGSCSSTKPLVVHASLEDEAKQTKRDRWAGLAYDTSDDQQDITRGKGMVDTLFQGASGAGTQDPVLSSLEYLSQGQRIFNFDNMKDGYYIAPAFMDKIVVHIAKNFMDLPNIKVPLILGIWGGKGQGKSFQCELVLAKLGINPIMMSAGELESGNAGEPAKLIRQRYREAADIIRKKGKMCVLFINDLDAGAGRMGGTTQYTVNNQMVNATLMNIADNPTNVQLPGVYNKEEIPRVPIIVTGNDFSTLYAPLIRDGRMEKFYWAPTREDRIGVCKGIFREDNVPEAGVVKLVDTFPGQSIDFFGALRARVYDDEVRKWVGEIGVENMGKKLVNSKDGPPTFGKPVMTVEKLLEYGQMLVLEQENVKRVQLAEKYLNEAALGEANDDSIKRGTFYGVDKPAGKILAEAVGSEKKEVEKPVAQAEESNTVDSKSVIEEAKEIEAVQEAIKEETSKEATVSEAAVIEEAKKAETVVDEIVTREDAAATETESDQEEKATIEAAKVEEISSTNGAAVVDETVQQLEKKLPEVAAAEEEKPISAAAAVAAAEEEEKKAEQGRELSRAVVTDALRGLVNTIFSVLKR